MDHTQHYNFSKFAVPNVNKSLKIVVAKLLNNYNVFVKQIIFFLVSKHSMSSELIFHQWRNNDTGKSVKWYLNHKINLEIKKIGQNFWSFLLPYHPMAIIISGFMNILDMLCGIRLLVIGKIIRLLLNILLALTVLILTTMELETPFINCCQMEYSHKFIFTNPGQPFVPVF